MKICFFYFYFSNLILFLISGKIIADFCDIFWGGEVVNFRILSYSEESKLTVDQKKQYYEDLKQYLVNLDNRFIDEQYTKLCDFLNPHIKNLVERVKGYELIIDNTTNIPNSPVIFASSHQNFYDHFNMILSSPTNSIFLNNKNIPLATKLALMVNGVVFVDRTDAESKFNSKISLMKHIVNGKSIIIFPEGTYNCSPNRLILPLHTGAADIAKKMEVPIIPIVQEYFFDESRLDGKNRVVKCILRFGEPFYVCHKDDIKSKTLDLRDELATLRYSIMDEKGLYSRKIITPDEYINSVKIMLRTYKQQKVDYKTEEEAIYGSNEEFYSYFPINALAYSSNGKILQKSLSEIVNKKSA